MDSKDGKPVSAGSRVLAVGKEGEALEAIICCHEMLKCAFVKHIEFYNTKSEALCKNSKSHLRGHAGQEETQTVA